MFFRRKKKSKSAAPKDETVFAESLRSLQKLISETHGNSHVAPSRQTQQRETPRQTLQRETAASAPGTTHRTANQAQAKPVKATKPELARTQSPARPAAKATPSRSESPPADHPNKSDQTTASAAPNADDFPVLTQVVCRPATPTRATPAAMAARIVDQVAREIGAPQPRWSPQIMARLTEGVRRLLEEWTARTPPGDTTGEKAAHRPGQTQR